MSGLIGGVAGYNAGLYNARAAEQEAHQALVDGSVEAERARQEARLAMGEAIAGLGTTGVQLGSGSALDVLQESAINAELDQLAIRTKAGNIQRAKKAEASAARRGATAALLGGIVSGATDVATLGLAAGFGGSGGGGGGKGFSGGGSGGSSGQVSFGGTRSMGTRTLR